MGERASIAIYDILYHYEQRIDSYIGRCDLLSLVADSIKEDHPKISRAVTTIAEDIRNDMVSMSDEIEIFLRAAKHNTLAGSVDFSELAVLHQKARTEWAKMAEMTDRNKPGT